MTPAAALTALRAAEARDGAPNLKQRRALLAGLARAVRADGTAVPIPPATETSELAPAEQPALPGPPSPGPTRRLPLGTVAGARSGDKGGGANIGVWVRTDAQWRWLAHALTVEKVRELLPEAADLPITRHLLPSIRAMNFVIDGILGQGVAYQARFDPQAKGLGEWLRSRHVDIPVQIIEGTLR